MEDEISFVDRINRVAVTGHDIRALIELMDCLPSHRRSVEAAIGRTIQLFPGESNRDRRRAVSCRLLALCRLFDTVKQHGFRMMRRPGELVVANDAILAAAAELPLVEAEDGSLAFDPFEIFRRAREYEARWLLDRKAV